MSQHESRGLIVVLALSAELVGCGSKGPCYWDGHQDRESGAVQAASLSCDGVAKDPATLRVRYSPTQTPLGLEIDAISFIARLAFEPGLPDGTYTVAGSGSVGKSIVTASGADVTGTFTFTRSRDIPFIDIASPDVKTYQSTLDATFDVVAVLPHPDPAMGVGCRLETGEQHVMLLVAGPVIDCKNSLSTGH